MNQPPHPQYSLRPKPWSQRWWGILIIIFLTLVLVVIFAFAFYTFDLVIKLKKGEISYQDLLIDQPVNQAEKNDYFDADGSPYLGNPEAKIVIVEFGDFACPFCQQSATIVKQLSLLYPQDIKIVFRNFPVVAEESLLAANAGACAHEQGNFAFWAIHDLIFENQDNFTAENLKSLAENLGLDNGLFNSCLDSNKYYAKIRQDLNTAYQAGAEKTPTFFINGQMIQGFQPLENWRGAIDYIIEATQEYDIN